MNHRRLSAHATFVACLLTRAATGGAQQSPDADLRQQLQSPVSGLTNVSFSGNWSLDAPPYGRDAFAFQVEPVVPLQVSKNWLLVPRILINAVQYQPTTDQAAGGTTGFGDMQPTFFLTPTQVSELIWGFGPAFLIPTATSSALGSGKWVVGPAGALLIQPKWGTVGTVIQNIWSFAGDPARPSVNVMTIEVEVAYNLPDDWYLISEPLGGINWTATSWNRWLVPVGGGIGRLFNIGKQSLSASAEIYGNVVRPQTSATWQTSLAVTLLFPNK
jgi:hypothetical protein